MSLLQRHLVFLFSLTLIGLTSAWAQEDPGKAEVGRVRVAVYFASNESPGEVSKQAKPVDASTKKRLQGDERLRFEHYLLLGEDTQPLLRSYENWAQPLKPSDEVLVRFEARSLPTSDSMRLDLEVWFSRKKTLKTDAVIRDGRPLFVLGPEWRGGRIIISVASAPKK